MKAKLKSAFGYQGNNLELPVKNVEAATPFYVDVLGFEEASRGVEPHRCIILKRDGIKIGLAENGGVPEQDGCAFHVESIEELWGDFKSRGLEQSTPEFSLEDHNGETYKVFFIIAPDGLCYWFGERQPPEA